MISNFIHSFGIKPIVEVRSFREQNFDLKGLRQMHSSFEAAHHLFTARDVFFLFFLIHVRSNVLCQVRDISHLMKNIAPYCLAFRSIIQDGQHLQITCQCGLDVAPTLLYLRMGRMRQ